MPVIKRRTIRFYDDETGIEAIKLLENLVNTNKGENERLVEDIYIAELLRKYYNKPLREVLVMLTSGQKVNVEPVAMKTLDTKHQHVEDEVSTIDVTNTISMLDTL